MIGFFDSGYGGMTILKPVLDSLPQYDYLYLGDNARAPYGSKSEEVVDKYCEEAVHFLFKKGAKLIIFACNTASSISLRRLQQKYCQKSDKKILGVLIPLAEEAASRGGDVGVVGTAATIKSQKYDQEILKLNDKIKVYSKACPLLVPLIEEDWHKKPEAKMILKKYLRGLKSANISSIILGCTHYPLMFDDFRRIMGEKVKVFNSGEVIARKLKAYLNKHQELESILQKNKKRNFYTSGDPLRFKAFVESHFSLKLGDVSKVDLAGNI